ncbi:Ger(x)C family spore germination protein [Paenibacillus sp. N4]|uniref:Ger(x)C family spore germination protein n=1 Tax=Paenibacillus vietnamensis TaxID=2590547 RepID=UPI001CD0A9F7|nr:Ger(x)C family spore germination protein [Paenibacillus vietnamensis]MCA0758029.1 Ger(x)C family spore germination protein [Paenibacillus vietnamensis]
MKYEKNGFRRLLIVLSIVSLLLLTGCWSKDEIEDLSLYVGLALDEEHKTKLEHKLDKFSIRKEKENILTLTVQVVDKQNEDKGQSQGSMRDPSKKAYLNISQTGNSIFEMMRDYATQLERPVVGHHLKVIVINEQLARRYSLPQLLDFFLRDNDIRQNCAVFMSNGLARNTMEAKGNTIVPAFRLLGMMDNRYRTLKIIPPVRLYHLEAKMHARASYLLQNVTAAEGEVHMSGAAVIDGKTQKFKGTLNEAELLGITWLRGDGKGGLIKCTDPETNLPVTYELKSMKSKIRSKVAGNQISFDVQIETEGRIIEDWSMNSSPIDEAFIERVEQSGSEMVSKLIKQALAKIQKNYKTDVVGFGTRLHIEHPRLWKQMKENWDERFADIPITYSVKLNITETGTEKSH